MSDNTRRLLIAALVAVAAFLTGLAVDLGGIEDPPPPTTTSTAAPTTTTEQPTTTTTVPTTTTTVPTGGSVVAANDEWLFIGDSITAMTISSDVSARVRSIDPDREITAINEGIGASTANSWRTQGHLTRELSEHDSAFVVVALGTNDNHVGFQSQLQQLVDQIVAAGRIPVLPHIPWPNGWPEGHDERINPQIDAVLAATPEAIPGADLTAATLDRPDLFKGVNDVHPNDAGQAALRQAHAEMIAALEVVVSAPSSGEYDDVPSDFDPAPFLASRSIPSDMSWEPSGNFRTFCQPSHLAHDDPIVHPGQPGAAHLHQFFGNPTVDAHSTYESLRSAGDSTCEGGPLNRTGYWTPAVFDGQGSVVVPDWILVYYKGGANGGTSLAGMQADVRAVEPYPNGLRMIADQHRWRCEGGSGSGSTIPNSCPTGEHLLAEVVFPFCWDGENLDSSDHRSHMAYKVRNAHTGQTECPASHPVHLPELTETFYYPWGSDIGSWYLSSDRAGMVTPAPDGSTLHADWFGAWDNAIQDRWVNGCIRGMRNGNNGDLCDGQGLRGGAAGMPTTRVPGWQPAS